MVAMVSISHGVLVKFDRTEPLFISIDYRTKEGICFIITVAFVI